MDSSSLLPLWMSLHPLLAPPQCPSLPSTISSQVPQALPACAFLRSSFPVVLHVVGRCGTLWGEATSNGQNFFVFILPLGST